MNRVETSEWLKKQKYQTALCETKEYVMYYGVDMLTILDDYYNFRKAIANAEVKND